MGHKPDIDADQWLLRCVQVADSVEVPNKAAYLGSLAILGNIIYDSQKILDIISEETMQHPPIVEYVAPQAHEKGFQKGIEQGIQEGIQEGTRKHILEILTLQLGDDTAQNFKASIEAIDDLQRLEVLFRAALQAKHEDEFRQAINETIE